MIESFFGTEKRKMPSGLRSEVGDGSMMSSSNDLPKAVGANGKVVIPIVRTVRETLQIAFHAVEMHITGHSRPLTSV